MDGYPYDTPPEAPRLRQTASYTALIRRQQQEQLAALYPHPSPWTLPPEPEPFEPVPVSQDAPFSTPYCDPGHRPFQQQQHPQHVQAPYWSASTTNSTSTYFTQSSKAPYSFPPSDVSRTYHTTRSAPTGSFSNLQDIERRPFQSPVDVAQQQRLADVQPETRRFSEADFRPTGLTAAQTEEAKALDLDESGKFGEMVDRKVEANTRKGKGREASTSSASTKEFSPDDGEEKGYVSSIFFCRGRPDSDECLPVRQCDDRRRARRDAPVEKGIRHALACEEEADPQQGLCPSVPGKEEVDPGGVGGPGEDRLFLIRWLSSEG